MTASTKPLLEVKNVCKSFGANQVHKGVSFELFESESIGLLGGSGTGKSVLLRSIIGLDFIDDGEIIFEGAKIDKLKEEQLYSVRKKIGYSFQSGALFDSQSVFENLAYPLYQHTTLNFEQITQKVKEIIKMIGLEGKEQLMPSDLSGGMQKRVGMARAIILGPKVILYDEPTAGLDPANTQNILVLMERLKSTGVSSIFVTHDIPAALKVCDRILILYQGKIAFNGSPKDFIDSNDPIVKNFFLSSLKEASP